MRATKKTNPKPMLAKDCTFDPNSNAEFLQAVRDNDIKTVLHLLESKKSDLNAKNSSENTALTIAVINNHMEVVRLLISFNCDLNSQNIDQDTALMLAAYYGHKDIAQYLSKQEACDLNLQNKKNQDTALTLAIYKKHQNIAQDLIKQERCNLHLQDINGDTALILATSGNLRGTVQDLIESKRCDLNFQNKHGHTALIIAVREQHKEIATDLVLAGAKLDIVGKDKKEAFDYAKYNNNLFLISLLGQHKIQQQRSSEHLENELNRKDSKGNTRLILATLHSNQLGTLISLIRLKCDINLQNNIGNTALMVAVLNKNRESANILMESNCNLNIQNNYKDTALMLAVDEGNRDIVGDLIKLEKCDLNLQNKDQDTALILAIKKKHREIAFDLIRQKHRCNLNLKNQKGQTALMIAVREQHKETIRDLFLANAKLDILDNDNKTAFDYAVENKNLFFITLLITHQVQIQKPKVFLEHLILSDQRNPYVLIGLNFLSQQQKRLQTIKSADEKLTLLDDKEIQRVNSCITEIEQVNTLFSSQIYSEIYHAIHNSAGIPLHIIHIINAYDAPFEENRISFFNNRESVTLQEIQCVAYPRDELKLKGNTTLTKAISNNELEFALYLIKDTDCDLNSQNTDQDTALMLAAYHGHKDIARYLSKQQKCNLNLQNKAQDTALTLAINRKHPDIAQDLINQERCDLNLQDINKDTALMLAISNNLQDTIRNLIESKHCDFNLQNKHGHTALMIAVRKQNKEIARDLVLAGAKLDIFDNDNKTAFDYANELGFALYLIKDTDCDLHFKNRDGNTALMLAILNNQIEITHILIKSHRCNLDLKNQKGQTAFMIAVREQHKEVVTALVLAGAKLNTVDNDNKTAFDYAVESKNLFFIKLLTTHQVQIQKPKVFLEYLILFDQRDPYVLIGLNFLFRQQKHLQTINSDEKLTLLDDKEIQRVNSCITEIEQINTLFSPQIYSEIYNAIHNSVGIPLNLICIINAYDAPFEENRVSFFNNRKSVTLQEIKCVAYPRDKLKLEGNTTLIKAISNSELEFALYLIKDTDCDLNIKGNNDNTALIIAARNNYIEIARLLISHNCDLNSQNTDQDTALMLAAYHGHKDIARYLSKHEKCNLNLQNKYKDTALTLAIDKKHPDIAQDLIKQERCDLNLQDINKDTALILAISNNLQDVVRDLIESKRCDFNLQNKHGQTALMIAVREQHKEIARDLVLAGAKLDIIDKHNKTALDYAIESNNPFLINLLTTRQFRIEKLQTTLGCLISSCDQRDPYVLICLNTLREQQKRLQAASPPCDQKLIAPASQETKETDLYVLKLLELNRIFSTLACSIIDEITLTINNKAGIPLALIKIISEYDAPLEEDRISFFRSKKTVTKSDIIKCLDNHQKKETAQLKR